MMKLKWFLIQLGWVLAINWAQLTDPNIAMDFQGFQTDQTTIEGDDSRFESISNTFDTTIMAWVMIYENDNTSTDIWNMVSSNGDLINKLELNSNGDWRGIYQSERIGTLSGGIYTNTVPRWFHMSLSICHTSSWTKLWAKQWQTGNFDCKQTDWSNGSPAGIAWEDSTEVRFGNSDYGNAKGQLVDVRYTSGQCVQQGEIEAQVADTEVWSVKCSTGCWGPGNYSCDEFIQLVDPIKEKTLQSAVGSAIEWKWDDSRLMGRTANFSSDQVMFVGWFLRNASPTDEHYLQATHVANADGGDYSAMPLVEYNLSSKSFISLHNRNGDVDARVSHEVDPLKINDGTAHWVWVGAIACSSGTQLLWTATMKDEDFSCSQSYQERPFRIWTPSQGVNALYVGGNWQFGPGGSVKDVRYYHSHWDLDTSSIQQQFVDLKLCIEFWDKCTTPSICLNCNVGFVLQNSGQTWAAWYLGCRVCNGISQNNCQSCYDGWYFDGLDQCLACDVACSVCSSAGTTNCTECILPYFLQPSVGDAAAVGCATTCPVGYYGNEKSQNCETCHYGCQECSGSSYRECLVGCNSGYYEQPNEGGIVWSFTCPTGWIEHDSSSKCVTDSCDRCVYCQAQTDEAWVDGCLAGYYYDPLDRSLRCLTTCTAPNWGNPVNNQCEATCPDNHWADSQTRLCIPCADQIANCNTWDMTGSIPLCTKCQTSAFVLSEDGTTWGCPDQWVECDVYGCTECNEGEVIDNGNWTQTCSLGTYLSEGKCNNCIPNCISCEDSVSCFNCAEPFLKTNGVCECRTGYYELLGTCVKCDDTCLTWVSVPECTSCDPEEGRVLQDNGYLCEACVCILCSELDGYDGPLPSPSGDTIETVCHPLCGDGVLLGAEVWDDGNTENGDGCSSECETEEGFECAGTEVCVDLQSPKVELVQQQLSGNDYTLILSFSEPVVISGSLEDKIDITISGGILAFTWTMKPTNLKNYNAYELLLTVRADVPQNTECSVSINTTIQDMSGKVLDNDTSKVTLDSKISITQPQVIASATAVTRAAGAAGVTAAVVGPSAGAGGAASSGAAGGMSFNPARFWMLVETMQIINLMLYFTLPMPEILSSFFRVMSMANCGFMPNIFEFFIEDASLTPPVKFAEEGQATNFLLTAGDALGVVITNLILLGGVAILALIKPTPGLRKQRSLLIYPAPLRIAIEGYLDFNIAIGLQSRNLSDDSVSNIIGLSVSSVTIAAYIVLFSVIYTKVFTQPSIVLDTDGYKEVYGALYEDFKTTHAIYKCFIVAEKLRRTLFVIMIVALQDSPGSQIYSLIILQTIWVTICVGLRPKLTKSANLLMITLDVVLLISFCLLATLLDDDASNEYRVAIAWTVFGLLGGTIGIYSLFVLVASVVSLIQLLIQAVKKLANIIRKKNNKIFPQKTTALFQDSNSKSFDMDRQSIIVPDDHSDITATNFKGETSDPYHVTNKELFSKVQNAFKSFKLTKK